MIFYVEDEQYRTMVAELRRIAEAGFDEHAWLPDTLVATSAFARFVSSRVLEHAVVRNEAPFDFRKLNF
ncbi:MAG: hypothetical protein KatS3mg102_0049 [Planctomycetota bacterium]|nr:MAG: hypothetical protein KatS3mg102_0049 [Planctomycetota bacterium]